MARAGLEHGTFSLTQVGRRRSNQLSHALAHEMFRQKAQKISCKGGGDPVLAENVLSQSAYPDVHQDITEMFSIWSNMVVLL